MNATESPHSSRPGSIDNKDTPAARLWSHRIAIVALMLSATLVLMSSAPLLLTQRTAHAAHPFISRALRTSGLVPIGPWNEEDAHAAIGAARARTSGGSSINTKGEHTREIAIILKKTDLRKRGHSSASTIRSLKPGTVLLVMRQSESWLFVAHSEDGNLQVGWVHGDDVRRLP